MEEWSVVLVLVTLSGLGVTLWRAAYSYTKTTTQLQETIKSLQNLINSMRDEMIANSRNNSESHRRIFEWLERNDERLDEHDKELILMQEKLKKEDG